MRWKGSYSEDGTWRIHRVLSRSNGHVVYVLCARSGPNEPWLYLARCSSRQQARWVAEWINEARDVLREHVRQSLAIEHLLETP